MGTTWDANIQVNLYTNAQGVQRVDFSTLAFATTGATFPEVYREYTDPQTVSTDSYLSTDTKAALNYFFDQKRHQRKITVIKLTDYLDYDTDLSAAAENLEAVPYMWVTEDRTDANAQDFVDWSTSNKKFCYVQSSTPAVASGTGIFDTFKGANEPRVFPIYHHDDTQFVDLGTAAYFGADSPENTSTIAAYRTIVGATVNGPALAEAQKTTLVADSVNFYQPFKSVPIIYPGTMSNGTFADERVQDDWLESSIEEEIAQLLLDAVSAGSKISFDAVGLKKIEGCVRVVALKGYRLGHYELDSLVLNSQDISDYTSAEIQSREARISATLTRRGAIQTVTVNIGVVYQS